MKTQVIDRENRNPCGRWIAHWEHVRHGGKPFQKTYQTRAEARKAIKGPSPCQS